MKAQLFNRYRVGILHILFWVVSFNIFNAFFSRGIESGFLVDELNLTAWNMLLISNITIAILLSPFIWLFKGINRWVKWSVTALVVTALLWSFVMAVWSGKESIIPAVVVMFFLDNFLYVLLFHLTVIGAVYLNARILIPKYLSQGKFGIYLFSVTLLAIVSAVANYTIFDLAIDKIFPQLFYISWFQIWELIVIMSAYLVITTIAFLLWQYRSMLISNREKVKNELLALRAQINPHFLFNNLNTIYGLAEKGDQRTKDVILQLSDFLRYVLYDTSNEKIDLEKEIEIIRTYVELQKERINRNSTEVILNTDGDFSGAQITPLLLLPLAENCFKHGIGNKKGRIEIDIKFQNQQFYFHTLNSIERRENLLNHEDGGIGIRNVEKRLNLLYPGKHRLTLKEEGELFSVDLTITLD